MENRMEVPQNVKNRTIIWSSSSTYEQNKNRNFKNIFAPPSTFITALFTIAMAWKTPKCPWSDHEWRKGGVHTQNRILFSHKEGNPAICNTQMNLEGTMLSAIAKQRETNAVWFHLHGKSLKTELIKTESRLVIARGGVGENGPGEAGRQWVQVVKGYKPVVIR